MKNRTRHQSLIVLALSLIFCSMACGNDKKTNYVFPSNPKPSDKFIKTELTGYPTGMKVYYFSEDFEDGKKCSGYLAIIDLKINSKLRFNAVHQKPAKKPSEIHARFDAKGKGSPKVTINGGYFWDGASLSLLISDGDVKSIENQVVVRKNSAGEDVSVYPLRAAFGRTFNGNFETNWIYCVLDNNNKPYGFLSPLDNDERTKTYMPDPPKSTTPGAISWTPQEAIGGGPMLVKSGANVAVDSYWKEVFDGGGIAGLSRQPRTAIGTTDKGHIIILVCDGRNMNGSSGYTLEELAERLIWQEAKIGINLDGGGSSTFVGKDGQVLNRPSDSKNGPTIIERKVPTAIVISEK